MNGIVKESENLVSRLREVTKLEGGVNSFDYLKLFSLNIIFSTYFGRKFDDLDDLEFIRLTKLTEDSMKHLGLELTYVTLHAFSTI